MEFTVPHSCRGGAGYQLRASFHPGVHRARELHATGAHACTEKILPGRWEDARQPNEKELKATSILKLPLTEVSAKVRSGPVQDEEEDYALPVWAGIVPLHLQARAPIRDERCDPAIPVPAYAASYRRP